MCVCVYIYIWCFDVYIYITVYTLSIYSFVSYTSRKEDCREIKPVNPKENQPWMLIRRTDTEAEVSVLWSLDVMCWLIEKDPDARKDWRQEEKGVTEDEMVAWHHQLNGHEFEQTPGDRKAQGSLVCCSPWGCKELDMA